MSNKFDIGDTVFILDNLEVLEARVIGFEITVRQGEDNFGTTLSSGIETINWYYVELVENRHRRGINGKMLFKDKTGIKEYLISLLS
jgi:hypothetical protein